MSDELTIEESVSWVIDTFEGHLFTDDPVDTGGATRHGITLRTLQYYRRKKTGNPRLVVTKADVRNLTIEEAVACGVEVFAVEPRIDELTDWRVRLLVFDYGFHSGQKRAVKALQQALRMKPSDVDGRIGPRTLAAEAAAANPVLIALRVLTTREEFMQDIIFGNKSQRKWMPGWWVRTTRQQRLITRDE